VGDTAPHSSLQLTPGPTASSLQVPTSQAMVSLGQTQRNVPQPLLDSAINALNVWRPLDQESLRREIDAVWRHLHEDEAPPPRPGTQPVNGNHAQTQPSLNGNNHSPGGH